VNRQIIENIIKNTTGNTIENTTENTTGNATENVTENIKVQLYGIEAAAKEAADKIAGKPAAEVAKAEETAAGDAKCIANADKSDGKNSNALEITIDNADGNKNGSGIITEVTVAKGTTVLELFNMIQGSGGFVTGLRYPVLAAKVDFVLRELDFQLEADCRIRFIDRTETDGLRIYRRSLYFMYTKALYDLFPQAVATMSHSISKGLFCDISGVTLTDEDVKRVKTG